MEELEEVIRDRNQQELHAKLIKVYAEAIAQYFWYLDIDVKDLATHLFDATTEYVCAKAAIDKPKFDFHG